MSEYTENENVMDEALEAAEETVEETEEIVEAEEAADEETATPSSLTRHSVPPAFCATVATPSPRRPTPRPSA